MRDYYYILGIPKNATEKEIKTAYRKLSLKFHPDKNNGEKFFEERFIQIQEAYETLSDPYKKGDYDDQLNKFNSSQEDGDNLHNIEEELKRKFEEEFRRREEEIKRNYQSRENKIKEEYFEKGKTTTAKPENKKAIKSGLSFGQYFLIFFITSIALYLIRLAKTITINHPNSEIVTEPSQRNAPINEQTKVEKSNFSMVTSSTPDPAIKAQDGLANTSKQLQDSINQKIADDPILVLNNNEEIPLSKYPDESYVTAPKEWSKNQYFDIDGDGIKELLVERFTGGAHCCVVYSLFSQISLNKYQLVYNFGFSDYISITKNKILVCFSEQLGYFHSCYACSIHEQLPYPEIYDSFYLIYKDRDIHFPNIVDDTLNIKILRNLSFLKDRVLPKLDSQDKDDGTRKSYAKLLTSYFFNNNRNLQITQEIFNTYYFSEDKSQIWKEIQDFINSLLKNYCPRVPVKTLSTEDTENIKVEYKKGKTALDLGNYQQCIKCFKYVIENSTDSDLIGSSYGNLGVAYLNMGNNIEGIAMLDQSCKLNPTQYCHFSAFNKGLIFSSEKNFKSAIEEFNKCISLEPKGINNGKTKKIITGYRNLNFQSHYQIGLILASKYKDYNSAVTHLIESIEPYDEESLGEAVWRLDALNNISYCYYELRNDRKCIEFAQKVLEINKYDKNALMSICYSYGNLGDSIQAKKYCKMASDLGDERAKTFLKNH